MDQPTTEYFLARADLQRLLDALSASQRKLIGPVMRDGAILFAPLQSTHQLPWGLVEQQEGGNYRLLNGNAERAFAWTTGPQALKPLLFSPEEPLWSMTLSDSGPTFHGTLPPVEPLAVIGLRSCDLAALALHDQHFTQGPFTDPHYARRREGLFIVAVNCARSAPTCFCHSTGDGPNAESGYDLLLDELNQGYVVSSGSAAGRTLLAELALQPTDASLQQEQATQRAKAGQSQQRALPTGQAAAPLAQALDYRYWESLERRCLACGNCTSVCPTCFCHTQADRPALDNSQSEHLRLWDSCFSEGHSYIHGLQIRSESWQRYRQWFSHKLVNWQAQFGRSGCVGCGRCISWCPVGIDITEEAARIVDMAKRDEANAETTTEGGAHA